MRYTFAVALGSGLSLSASSSLAVIVGTDSFTMSGGQVANNSFYQAAAGGQAVGTNTANAHATLWTAAAPGGIDLNPAGVAGSAAYAVRNGQQVGDANGHARLWTGTAASAVDLHPGATFMSSTAFATDGAQQAGSGRPVAGRFHALLWSGTAASAVDLNPDALTDESRAYGVGGGRQVGYAKLGPNPLDGTPVAHAAVWSGTAASVADLNPAGFYTSYAYGTDGERQVGTAYNDPAISVSHALLWSGTAASAVDLTPAGFTQCFALAVGDGLEVGYGLSPARTGNAHHALLWSGTAGGSIDLHAFLPAGRFASSKAYSVSGTTAYGVAIDNSGLSHAVVWTGVPEPAFASLLGIAGLCVLRRRRDRTR